jgi:hypothetical protein
VKFMYKGVEYEASTYRKKMHGWMVSCRRLDGKNCNWPRANYNTQSFHYEHEKLDPDALERGLARTVEFLKERHERYRESMKSGQPDSWAQSYWDKHSLNWRGY